MQNVTAIVQETASQSSSPNPIEQVFSPETIQQLHQWGSTIMQRASTELSSSSDEAIQVGRFSCLVDDAAHSLKRLFEAYQNGGQQERRLQVSP